MMMASKVKFCAQISSCCSHFCRPLQNVRSYSGLAAVSRWDNHPRVPIHSPLLNVSPQNLPGNYCPTYLTSIGFVRTKRTMPADSKISWSTGAVGIENIEDYTPLSDDNLQQAVTDKINDTLEHGREGRLYAVVYVRSLQYKVTAGDIIIVKHDFPPNVGDKLRLEKVLAVGGSDFTLLGQPLLSRDKVLVEATVVEKTLSHNRVWFVYRRRSNFKKFHLFRERQTMLLINSVRVARLGVGDHNDIEIDEGKRDSNL